MGDRAHRGSFSTVQKLEYSWCPDMQRPSLLKSAVFSHNTLPGVQWQLQLRLNTLKLVMVSNKHYNQLSVTIIACWHNQTNSTIPSKVLTNQSNSVILEEDTAGKKLVKCLIEVTIPSSMDFPPDIEKHGFGSLLSEGFQSDVKFIVQDKTIAAHKLVLAAKSPVFRRMFYDDRGDDSKFRESQSNTVVVDDASPEAFEAFLHLVYTDEEDEVEDEDVDDDGKKLEMSGVALEVLSMGHKYQVESVVRRASRVVQQELSNETVLQAVDASKLYEDKELEEACARYIADGDNLHELSRIEGWSSFISRNSSFIASMTMKMRCGDL